MAKGDHSRVQNQVDYQGGKAQNQLTNTFNNLLPQNQSLQNRYNISADQSNQNYGQMYQGYNDLYNQMNQGYGNLYGQTQNAFQPQRDVYNQFAQTGGYSPQDIQDLRARGIAPTRAVYENAQADIDRQRALSGGYSPNYIAAKAKLTRDLSNSISDTNVNVNAQLADAIRSGKLAGASGLNATDTSQLGLLNNVLGGQSNALNTTLGGQRSLYGTAPGATSMYGQQLGQSNEQMNNISQLQNQISQMIINGQLGVAGVPGNYQQALGNIGGTLGLAGQVGGMIPGLGNLTGGLYKAGTSQTPAGYIGG